jgi:hypothetical protein
MLRVVDGWNLLLYWNGSISEGIAMRDEDDNLIYIIGEDKNSGKGKG